MITLSFLESPEALSSASAHVFVLQLTSALSLGAEAFWESYGSSCWSHAPGAALPKGGGGGRGAGRRGDTPGHPVPLSVLFPVSAGRSGMGKPRGQLPDSRHDASAARGCFSGPFLAARGPQLAALPGGRGLRAGAQRGGRAGPGRGGPGPGPPPAGRARGRGSGRRRPRGRARGGARGVRPPVTARGWGQPVKARGGGGGAEGREKEKEKEGRG